MEKAISQKNKHIEILIKEKERKSTVEKDSFKEYLADKLTMELRDDRTGTENYILDKNADLKQEVSLLREKISKLKEKLHGKDQELAKSKEDNFYLVTRLKNLRGPVKK